jgi:hypothetical protein
LYADMREEARDHARVRNAYFDQVCVTFLLEKFSMVHPLRHARLTSVVVFSPTLLQRRLQSVEYCPLEVHFAIIYAL